MIRRRPHLAVCGIALVLLAACVRPMVVTPVLADAALPTPGPPLPIRVALVTPYAFGTERVRVTATPTFIDGTMWEVGAAAEDAMGRWARRRFASVVERRVSDEAAAAILRGEQGVDGVDLVIVPSLDGSVHGNLDAGATNWVRLRLDVRDVRDGSRASWAATGEARTRVVEGWVGPMQRALASALRTLHDSVSARFDGAARAGAMDAP